MHMGQLKNYSSLHTISLGFPLFSRNPRIRDLQHFIHIYCCIYFSNETLKEEEEISENAKKEKKKISERSPIDVTMPLVLEPDHPMMERFQKALKNHLLKQIDKVTSQVCEMVHPIFHKFNFSGKKVVILPKLIFLPSIVSL